VEIYAGSAGDVGKSHGTCGRACWLLMALTALTELSALQCTEKKGRSNPRGRG
jgi:hypothetical protein